MESGVSIRKLERSNERTRLGKRNPQTAPPLFVDLAGKARWRFDPEWHRQRSGCLWDEMGKLLDMGCDFALGQSLFSHLPLNPVIRCIISVEKVLQPAGRFYATFFESQGPKFNLNPVVQRQGELKTYFDKNLFHYNREVFE